MAEKAQKYNKGDQVTDAADIQGYNGAPLTVAATATQSAQMPEGLYDIGGCANACYLKIDAVLATVQGVTAANGYYLAAGSVVTMLVREGDYIGAISTGAGTLNIHKVK